MKCYITNSLFSFLYPRTSFVTTNIIGNFHISYRLHIYIMYPDIFMVYLYSIYIYIFDRNLIHMICSRHEFCSNFMARKNCIQSLQKHHARNGLLFPQHTFLDQKLVIFQWLDSIIHWFKTIIIRLWGWIFQHKNILTMPTNVVLLVFLVWLYWLPIFVYL